MLYRTAEIAHRIWRVGMAAILTALWGCGDLPPPASAAAIPGIPPGEARFWIYRTYEPYETLERPYVRLNDQIVGISEPGGAFYRDVRPESYRVNVDSCGYDVNQFANVAPVAGQTVFIKIETLKLWWGWGRSSGGCVTFYTRLIPSEVAQAEVARSPFYGGG